MAGLKDVYLKTLETTYSKEIPITYYVHFVSTKIMHNYSYMYITISLSSAHCYVSSSI